MFAQLVDIFKLRIGVLMAITALAGFAVTPGKSLSSLEVLVLALSVLGASAAAGAFNQYAERDLDARMARTRSRPFVTGAASHNKSWLWLIAALLLISVGMACWMFNFASGFHVFMGAFVYGVVYTLWLKQRTVWNIVIGGAAGSFAVLAGAAAADPSLNMPSLLLAAVLFLWTPPHFWALAIVLHKDYATAGVPMLPVVKGDETAAKIILVNILILVAVSLLPGFYGMGWVYLSGAILGGAYFIYKGVLLVHDANPKTAIRCFIASLVQLTLLLIAAMIDPLL
ncbi:MAG: heme o synthase [Pseudomonadales bacterium]|nr:heme o synthase [Pseudomonadales bacterium]